MEIKKKVEDCKLKPLKPTLRQKKRFILVKIHCDKKLDFKDISKNLIDNLTHYIGFFDFSSFGIWVIRDKFNFEKQEFLLRVSTKGKDKVVGALSLIGKINDFPLKYKIITISGTIKGTGVKIVQKPLKKSRN